MNHTRSSIVILLCLLIIYDCHSTTYPVYPGDQSRRLSPPAYSPNSVSNTNYNYGQGNKYGAMPIDRDAPISGLQPPGSSLSLMSASAPGQVGMVPYQTGSDDMTTMPSTTTSENPILADMKPNKVKFNLPAVLVVFVVFFGVVLTLFLRITFLHALLVAGNKSSVQINGRFTLWGNNNAGINRPNGMTVTAHAPAPLSDINSHFTRRLVNGGNFFDDAWDLTISILNAISQVSDKWAVEQFEAENSKKKKTL